MRPTAADITPGASVLILPLGSWEQHGPHLPLDTDSRIISAIIDAALVLVDHSRFHLAPVIPVTASDEHSSFPGTLSAGTETTAGMIVAIARSAAWARGVCIVNGHGGNAGALAIVRQRLSHERVTHSVWSPSSTEDDDLHAGFTETSLMMHVDPGSVRIDRMQPGHAVGPDDMTLMRESGIAAVSTNGILGDPTRANPAAGRDILERHARSLADHLSDRAREWSSAKG